MSRDLQTLFDAPVVIQTILRPTLVQAVRSVYEQSFAGSIQILLGVDSRDGPRTLLEDLGRYVSPDKLPTAAVWEEFARNDLATAQTANAGEVLWNGDHVAISLRRDAKQ
jgi:hypothetical protein